MGQFLHKNINLFLIFIIILMVGAVIVLSLFYEKRFESASGVYRFTNTNLSTCRAELLNTQQTLQKLTQSLNTTEGDIRKYDELYVTKANELEQKRSEVESIRNTLSSTEQDLAEFKAKFEAEKNQVDTLQAENNRLSVDNANLRSDIDRKNKLIQDLQNTCTT